MNIEDTFKPDTVTELLLYRRIMELKRGMFEKGVYEYTPYKPGEIDMAKITPQLKLSLLNVIDIDREEPFGVKIIARSYHDEGFSLATYVSNPDLYQLNSKMDLVMALYKRALLDLAKMYEEKEIDE